MSEHKELLLKLSMRATGNSREDTESDYMTSMQYLESFDHTEIPNLRKPKGTVSVILSMNEPLLLSIVPVLSALAMGNFVIVRPSSSNIELFNFLWQELSDNCSLRFRIVTDPLEHYISEVKAVYFFGSHRVAKKIYQLCAEHFVEFIPEIEAADTQVFTADWQNLREDTLDRIIQTTLIESFTHDGKICQRITGVYVNRGAYQKYTERLKKCLIASGYSSFDSSTETNGSEFMEEVQHAAPKVLYRKDNCFVAIHPNPNSTYVNNAYFEKSLWVIPYENMSELIHMLVNRPYRMGLNIVSDNKNFTDQVIQETSFSRYTIGSNHCDIGEDAGWGGNWPTGVGGYKDWFTLFSNGFTILDRSDEN